MVRVCRVVPKEWTKYSPIGNVIPRTRFIVFKTPLNEQLSNKVSREQRFTVSNLLWMLAQRGQRLGLVVDLTDTERYYDKKDIEGMCIEYEKINCPGRGFVDRDECVSSFNQAIQNYIDGCEDPEALIGVHCTHGVNRSGYLICRFLIERLGWSSHEALEAFELARGYPIEKGAYVQALHKAAIESRTRKAGSDSDSDDRRRKTKKAKRKRDREDNSAFGDSAKQMGDMMQQFFVQLGQQARELEAGSGYGSPAVSANYASPVQHPWAYTQKVNTSHDNSPFIETQDAEDEEVEDTEDNELEDNSSDLPVSKSQKRRDRRLRMQKMLAVMKRGRFHEIQEMQKEYLNRGAK